MEVLALAVGLVVYSNLLNLWPPFNKEAFVPLNLTAAALILVFALGPLDMSLNDLGVTGNTPADAFMGMGLGVVITVPLFVAVAVRRGLKVIADERVAHLTGGGIAYQALIRVPFGTALLEELAFRGALLGAWEAKEWPMAALASSLAFGLWHITSTLNLVRANQPHAAAGRTVGVIAGAVVLTTAVGLALVYLRRETGGLLAPFCAHASVNGLATVAGVWAHRKLTEVGQAR